MRTISFREVLWEVAWRLGLDPTSDLSTEHAVALGLYINSVVRQSWHAADWPEWTYTQPRTPNVRHIVGFEAPVAAPADIDSRIGRVLKVYLNDPDVVQPPLEIAHRLTSEGVHCGFEHGTQVWVKFQPPAPAFTAFAWNGGNDYRKGQVVYSPTSGECYESKSNGNKNHDPAEHGVHSGGIGVELIQTYRPDSPGLDGQTQITRIDVDFAGNIVEASHNTISVQPSPGGDGPATTVTYIALTGDTDADVVDALAALLTAEPTLSAFTITTDTSADPPWIKLEADQAFTITQAMTVNHVPPGGPIFSVPQPIYFPVVILQTYAPPVPFTPGQPQVSMLKLSDTAALPGATYRLVFIDEAGASHILEYVNPDRNSAIEVLQGIVLQLQFLKVNDPDPFWDRIQALIHTAQRNVWFGIHSVFSLDATIEPLGSPWWRLIRFPVILADHVIRGAKASAIAEEGQTDKAAADEAAAAAMAAGQALTLEAGAFNPLTDQAKPAPRYRIEGGAPIK